MFPSADHVSAPPETRSLPAGRCGCPVVFRNFSSRWKWGGSHLIVTMVEFHKNSSKDPFLWNFAAAAARINRKAVYSADINIIK